MLGQQTISWSNEQHPLGEVILLIFWCETLSQDCVLLLDHITAISYDQHI